MHQSRLAGLIIDCQMADRDAAAGFWSAALGMPLRSLATGEEKYRGLDADGRDLHIEVQQVEHPSRVHLDIETDDIAAEVRRLEALGAKCVGKVDTWVVMEAPSGQRFCVVRVQSAEFAATAKRWD